MRQMPPGDGLVVFPRGRFTLGPRFLARRFSLRNAVDDQLGLKFKTKR